MQYEDDIAFQRAIMANPSDTTLKLVYADWLQDRADPRAEYVRLRATIVSTQQPNSASERVALEKGHEQLRELGRGLDPVWVSFMDTLAQPFAPTKFNWHEPDHPFTEPAGQRGSVVFFESQYRTAEDWEVGLLADITFVATIEWRLCTYGMGGYQVRGFVCDLPTDREPLSARHVLSAIKAADFRSEHIADLDATDIPFPGRHPGTANDEIHTEFAGQHMFDRQAPGAVDAETANTHGLKDYVVDGRLWYVLLHIGSKPCPMVVLLAVGRSPMGKRLVGAITRQMCEYLCD